jgi:hypothetical protein
MHIDVLSVTIRAGLNAIRGPVDVAVMAVKNYVDNHPFSMLYICGNQSRVLDHLRGDFDVRRAFTVYQLFSILEDVYQDVVFIEHDPLLFEDVGRDGNYSLVEILSLAMKDVARRRLVLYFSTTQDVFFDVIVKNSDRVLFFEKEPGGYFIAESESYRGCRRFHHRFLPKGQTTLKAF